MSTLNRPYGFTLGFDLVEAPDGTHEKIIEDIEEKYKDNARWVLDTTWIIKSSSTSSSELYREIQTIITKHMGSKKFYLSVWKIDFSSFKINFRPMENLWFKKKFGF